MPASGVGQHAGTPGEHHRNLQLRIAKYYLSNLPNTLAILIVAKQRGKKLWLVRAFIQMRQIN